MISNKETAAVPAQKRGFSLNGGSNLAVPIVDGEATSEAPAAAQSDAMKSFFETVLPSSGFYFLATPSARGWIHFAYQDIPTMVAKATELNHQKRNVYFACASFDKESYIDTEGKTRRRTADNAASAQSYWLDIDCGEEKARDGTGYKTPRDAAKALQVFCRTHRLPEPMIVFSGGGLHCYWPLTSSVTKPEWLELALKLKELTKFSPTPLLVDQTRTADVASVLRPVGTNNWKPERGGAEVILIKPVPSIPFEQFKSTITAAHQTAIAPHLGEAAASVSALSKALAGGLTREPVPETEANVKRVRSALAVLNPDCGYALWRDIVFAVHSTQWSCGEELARTWSMGALRKGASHE